MKRFVLMGLVALTAAVAISDTAEARLFRRGRSSNNCGSNCYSGGCGQNACGGGNCQANAGWQDPNMMQSQTFDPNAPNYPGQNGYAGQNGMNGRQTFSQQPGQMQQGNTTFYRGQPQQSPQAPQPQLAPNARANGNANIRGQGTLNQGNQNLGTQNNLDVDRTND
jgi:hypothetical protein